MTCQQAATIYIPPIEGVCVCWSKAVGTPRPKPQSVDRKGSGDRRDSTDTHTPPSPPYINNNTQTPEPTTTVNEVLGRGNLSTVFGSLA